MSTRSSLNRTTRPPLDYEPNLDWLLEPPSRTFTIGPERGRVPAIPAAYPHTAVGVYRGTTGTSLRLVAYVRGIPRAGLHVDLSPGGATPYVANVFVAPEARRQGWATRLFRQAEAIVGEKLGHSKVLSLAATWWMESLR